MLAVLRRLSLGLLLIAATSAILLWSDAPRRAPLAEAHRIGRPATAAARAFKIGLMQMTSQPILDEGAQGVVDGLSAAGFRDGESLTLRRFNAEGDVATANAMAQELTGGDYDLVITLTTGALQAVANANQQRKTPHVFGLVTDPTKSGVGVGAEPLDHPPYMVGIGTLQPVAESLRMAKRLNPRLTRVGVAWNPAEVNSEICTLLARQACQELQVELLEATVENSAVVKEAVASLVARDVELLWIGGDVTVLGAFDVVAQTAREARIPICTCMPGNAARGSLFDIGANYYQVGVKIGELAGRVLHGEDIARLPVTKTVPPKLFINTLAPAGLRDSWTIPTALVSEADAVIDADGVHDKTRREPSEARP